MNHVEYFKDLFESIPNFRKLILLMFLFKNNDYLSTDCGYLKNHNNGLYREF